MQYIVSSRGRPIGVTDLGSLGTRGPFRFGWFHPNAEGERLMPVIAAVLPAMRACVDQHDAAEYGVPPAQSQLGHTPLYADVAEALHHVAALDLSLHREDGSLVPTEEVGIQDTEQLLALAREARHELEAELRDEAFDDPLLDAFDDPLDDPCADDGDDELDLAIAHDLELLLHDDEDLPRPWMSDDELESPLPRYQIHVVLADEDAIP